MATQLDTLREKEICRVTWQGSIVNLLLMSFKFIAGFAGNSVAMIADAVHSVSDFVTDILVVIFVRISGKPADGSHAYGHGKYETFAALIIALLLLAVGGGICYQGVVDVIAFCKDTKTESPQMIALIAALASMLLKELLYRYTIRKSRKLESPALAANAWHHRSDALSSVGTTLGIGGAVLLGGKWAILDPLAAVVVSLLIVKESIKLLRPCFDELLERSLPESIEREIEAIILSFPDVSSPHHLRTRRIGNDYAIEVHIRMEGSITLEEAHRRASKIEQKIKEKFGENTHIGIHMEPKKQE